MTSKPRIDPDDLSAEDREKLGPWADMNFSLVMMQSPALNAVFTPLIGKLIGDTALPPRDRQVIVLRILELADDLYEVTHHELISKSAGLNDEEIAAMRRGEGDALTDFDKVLISATEQLFAKQYIDDETWQALGERYSKPQLMEVVILAGAYLTMAMVTRNFQIPLEDDETFANFAKKRDYT